MGGVSFEIFYRSIIAPALRPDTVVTHVVFRGLDGYRSVVSIEDVLADDVLIAERLDGRPLDGDHGAPARLVSPAQYGYVSTKHLCRVEVHTAKPKAVHASPITNLLFRPHPRARVWEEERHGYFRAWSVRPLYRALKAPLLYLCARGSGQSRTNVDELRTRLGRMRIAVGLDRLMITAFGHVGPRLVRAGLARTEQFGLGHPEGWWYVVDKTHVTLPNPLNLRHLHRIHDLPGLTGYVVIAPRASLHVVGRLLSPISRPTAIVKSSAVADRFIEMFDTDDRLPLFIYDGSCGFCRRWAGWLADRVGSTIRFEPFELLVPSRRHGLTEDDLQHASYLVDEARLLHRGGAAFAEVLKRARGWWPVAGLVLDLPGVRILTERCYAAVVKNRHRLPAPSNEGHGR